MTPKERLALWRKRRHTADGRVARLNQKIKTRLIRLAARPALAAHLAREFDLRFTSGWRSVAHNAAVGGVLGSWHTRGTRLKPAASDLVGTEWNMDRARRWVDGNVPNVAENMIHDVGSGRHLHVAGWGVASWQMPKRGLLKEWRGRRVVQLKKRKTAEGKIKALKATVKRATSEARTVAVARRHGARHALWIIREARAEGVPLSWAFALVEQETNFRHIFGGDHGVLRNAKDAPFFRVPVTRARVQALIRWVNGGNASNGVGLTQLTSIGYINRAEQAGGAHKVRVNLRIGFRVLREKAGGHYTDNAWKYNGSPAYQAQIEAKRNRWAQILQKG